MSEQKKINPADFFSALKSGNKVSGSDVLVKLANKDSGMNLHMITNLSDAGSGACVLTVAKWLSSHGHLDLSNMQNELVNNFEQLSVSVGKDNRANKIISAIESVLRQEFEKEKLSNKLMGKQQGNL